MKKGICVCIAFLNMAAAYAGIPVWTIEPLTATTLVVPPASTATVQYLVTNQSFKTHALSMIAISGITQNTTAGLCSNLFTLAYKQSCTLSLTVTGDNLRGNVVGGPKLCQQGNPLQCYQPSQANSLNITKGHVILNPTTLSTSVSDLFLSASGFVEYGVSGTPTSGVPRSFTITNTGSNPTVNLTVHYPTWPSGTTASSTCPSALAAGDSCTVTIVPGPNATSNCSTGTAPTPGVISISAANASAVSTGAAILSYACIYQGGYIFALDDTPSTTSNIGGKVATTTNQSPGLIWSSNSSGTYDGGISIYGISQTSTSSSPVPSTGQVPGQTACNALTDGACNTTNIVAYYSPPTTDPAIDPLFYGAGICTTTIASFSDWYLPAVCEMSYGTILPSCGSPTTPTTQNMQTNLVERNNVQLINGHHWSSTQEVTFPQTVAWDTDFESSSGFQFIETKNNAISILCVRAIT